MSNNRNLIYSAVYGIINRNNKIVLMRRFNTGYKDGYFTLPAGHIEENELPKETMIREIKEETGIICKKEDLNPIHVIHRITDTGRTYVDYFFEIQNFENEPIILESNKCDVLDWFDINELPENTLEHVKETINHIKNKIHISEKREVLN